jgi:hypothetical protein
METGTTTSNPYSFSSNTQSNDPGDYAQPLVVLVGIPESPISENTLSIAVSGTDISEYRYRLDSGTYSETISINEPILLTELTQGEHTLYVIGANPAGIWQPSPTIGIWEVNTSTPLVVLLHLPSKNGAPSSSTITVTGEDVVNYSYQIDTSGYSGSIFVDTPIQLTGLADGEHTIDVKGQNSLGVWQQIPTSYTWNVNASVAPPNPGDPPTGSITINNGAMYTTTSSVTLKIDAKEYTDTDPLMMRFRNESGTWAAWETYNAVKAWTLDNVEGERIVEAQFLDHDGTRSEDYIIDTINLDITDPTGGFTITNDDDTNLNIVLNITSDDGSFGSGVEKFRVKDDSGAWTDWMSYVDTYNMTMPPGVFGTRTVSIQFRDASFRTSVIYSQTTTYSGTQAVNIIYVSQTNGDNGKNGQSIANAVQTISEGINKAQIANAAQVHVEGGIYDETVTLVNGISLFGGFDIGFSARDPEVNVTMIQATSGDYSLLIDSSITPATTVSGFSIIAPDSSVTDFSGGMHVDGANLTITDCDFVNNNNVTANLITGLVIENNASMIFRNIDVTIDSNATTVYGFYMDSNSTAEIEDIEVNISNPTPTTKYGIYLGAGTITQIKEGYSKIISNRFGYAIYLDNCGIGNVIEDMEIHANSSDGGIALTVNNCGHTLIRRNRMIGGSYTPYDYSMNMGLEVVDSDPTIINNVIYGSWYTSDNINCLSAAIRLTNSDAIISNNTLAPSRMNDSIDYNYRNNDERHSFCIRIQSGRPTIVNNIFSILYSDFSSSYDGEYRTYGVYENAADSDPMIFNNNLFIYENISSSSKIRKFYYYNNDNGTIYSDANINIALNTTQGAANSSQNNLYGVTLSDIFASVNADWHLKAGCLAIDNGVDTSSAALGLVEDDRDKNVRIEPYDIGAYEF